MLPCSQAGVTAWKLLGDQGKVTHTLLCRLHDAEMGACWDAPPSGRHLGR
jgi:hypothetical protein